MTARIDLAVIYHSRYLVRHCRKRSEIFPFFGKDFDPAVRTLLERLGIVCLEFSSYSILKRCEVMECDIPQFRYYVCSDIAHSSFGRSFLFGFAYPGRHDCCYIVESKTLICIGQDYFSLLGMLDHAGLEVVADSANRHTAECFIHPYVASHPGVHLHIQRWFYICISAVGQAGYKEIYCCNLAGIAVNNLHGRTAPVDLAA